MKRSRPLFVYSPFEVVIAVALAAILGLGTSAPLLVPGLASAPCEPADRVAAADRPAAAQTAPARIAPATGFAAEPDSVTLH